MAAEGLAKQVLGEIENRGILLVTDPVLPSVTRIVAGEPVSGSWWSHPRGREIFAVLESLDEAEGVMRAKLIAKKETFVHRSLWPQLFAVATSREGWQTSRLSAAAKVLLEEVEARGAVRLDQAGPLEKRFDRKTLTRAGRELEERLLVHGDQVHTVKGAHAKLLSSWQERSRKMGLRFDGVDVGTARAAFETRTEGRLPWHRASGGPVPKRAALPPSAASLSSGGQPPERGARAALKGVGRKRTDRSRRRK
jgi:hypothetical protein